MEEYVRLKDAVMAAEEDLNKALNGNKAAGTRVRKQMQERSEEHTSELQSHSFISYAVFCLKKKKH